MRIRTVLIDDDPHFSDGLCNVLKASKSVVVVGRADDVESGYSLIATRLPDVAIIDLSLKTGSGRKIVERVVAEELPVRMLIFSGYGNPYCVRCLLTAGAHGYVLKGDDAKEFPLALMDIARGNEYVSSTLRDRIADQEAMVRAVPGAESQPLTPREHEVAELTVDGYTIKATASKLGIRNSTVVTHRTRIMEKLRAASAVEVAQSLHGQEIDMYRHHLRFEWPCKKCRENPQACCRGKWGEG